jgi:hypothetical protein
MSNISETKLLRSNIGSLDNLEAATNQHIADGWQPRGPLLLATVGDTNIFVQQMVKYVPDEDILKMFGLEGAK